MCARSHSLHQEKWPWHDSPHFPLTLAHANSHASSRWVWEDGMVEWRSEMAQGGKRISPRKPSGRECNSNCSTLAFLALPFVGSQGTRACGRKGFWRVGLEAGSGRLHDDIQQLNVSDLQQALGNSGNLQALPLRSRKQCPKLPQSLSFHRHRSLRPSCRWIMCSASVLGISPLPKTTTLWMWRQSLGQKPSNLNAEPTWLPRPVEKTKKTHRCVTYVYIYI